MCAAPFPPPTMLDVIAAALTRGDLSARTRALLHDMQRQAARRPLTARQMQTVERIASAPPRTDFAVVNRAALARLPEVLARLLPGGRAVGAEWHAGSLRGEAGESLRVRLHGDRAGRWCDFATGDKGGDPVSLVAAVAGVPQDEAARRLARMEDPEARDFRSDFHADTMAARGALLRDVLTIWRWGRQMGDTLPAGRPLGSFGQWARWCRDPLLSLGCKDPVLRVAEAKAKDPRRQDVAIIFTAWWEAHGEAAVAVAELAETVRAATDPAGRPRQYLASRVRALEGTRAAGFVLARSPSVGKWSPDRYALQRTRAEAGAGSDDPMPPMPSAGERDAVVSGPGGWSDDL